MAMSAAVQKSRVIPPRPCINCSIEAKPLRKGLCAACNVYLRRTGRPRPSPLAKQIAIPDLGVYGL